ncbi:hypothetical protein [Psychrobacter sp. FDAARGOS_221]|uniref:hypothetical protein n=1 Tax=Psychrobacter sp. FDAARGOS_221 TaxID=1975705 RepID=UPI000BB534DC|nr:hypothetical protein [Psychrobacter sp. FDAARGOS_221]PNK59668.1 hypothetical protein A6J60_001400 [Psychrobacter sp. FDAARGOS_221]
MKKLCISLTVATGLALSAPAMAANLNGFLTPNSLGKNINTLNKQYNLGLTKADWDGWDLYTNSSNTDCDLSVSTKNDKVTEIKVSPNGENCRYKTQSSGITFQYDKTRVVDILNNAKLADIQFIPGCFNCPSRIELPDELVVSRPQDKYTTTFGISGYNDDYLKYMATKMGIKNVEQDYYPAMDSLEEKLNANPKAYNREDFKRQAIRTYDLKSTPWVFKITAK